MKHLYAASIFLILSFGFAINAFAQNAPTKTQELLELPGLEAIINASKQASGSAMSPKELLELYESDEEIAESKPTGKSSPAATAVPPQPSTTYETDSKTNTPSSAKEHKTSKQAEKTETETETETEPAPPSSSPVMAESPEAAMIKSSNRTTAKSQQPSMVQSIAEKVADKIDEAAQKIKNDTGDITTAITDAAKGEDPLAPKEYNLNAVWKHRPLMLSEREIAILNKVINSYYASLLQPIISPDGTPVRVNLPTRREYPFIVVDSIMFVADDDWAVWINRSKYTPKQKNKLQGISVEAVSANSVTLLWQPVAPVAGTANIAMDVAESEPIAVAEAGEPAVPSSTEEIPSTTTPAEKMHYLHKTAAGGYEITLSANQAFIPEDFSLYEGRAVNAKIAEIIARNQQSKIAAIAQTADDIAENPNPNDADRENVDKLMDLYKGAGIDLEKAPADGVKQQTQTSPVPPNPQTMN